MPAATTGNASRNCTRLDNTGTIGNSSSGKTERLIPLVREAFPHLTLYADAAVAVPGAAGKDGFVALEIRPLQEIAR